MPPRLAHQKSRLGCSRCKARKVKCDEVKPRCGACTRHSVPCEYPGTTVALPESNSDQASTGLGQKDDLLELQLMHEWVAYVSESISTTWQFWKYQAPVIAFKSRHVLDALLALSALHASRQQPRRWATFEGRMVSLDDGRANSMSLAPVAKSAKSAEWRAVTIKQFESDHPSSPEPDRDLSFFDHFQMLNVSRIYFDRALEGQRRALAGGLTVQNAKATFMCSILVSYYSLFTLSEESQSPDLPSPDPLQWFQLAHGTTLIITQWIKLVGNAWFEESGGMYGPPDLSNDAELFSPEHRKHFKYLLEPMEGEPIVHGDREAYEQALSYIGLMYRSVIDGSDLPLATCRRVVSMPSRILGRFPALVIEEKRPRALAMLAHVFAILKLVDDKVMWFKGIPARQVPFLCNLLPEPWKKMIEWPLDVVSGRWQYDRFHMTGNAATSSG